MTQVDGDRREELAVSAGRASSPESAEACFRLGRRLEAEIDLAGAAAAYRRADRHGHAEAAFRLGLLLEAQGKIDPAKAAYRRADRRGHGLAAQRRAALLAARGELGGARAASLRAQQRGVVGVPQQVPVATSGRRDALDSGGSAQPRRPRIRMPRARRILVLGLPPYVVAIVLLAMAFVGHGGATRHTPAPVQPRGAAASAAASALVPETLPAEPAVIHPRRAVSRTRPRVRPHRGAASRTVRVHRKAPRRHASSVISAASVVSPASSTPPPTQTFAAAGASGASGGYSPPTAPPAAAPPPVSAPSDGGSPQTSGGSGGSGGGSSGSGGGSSGSGGGSSGSGAGSGSGVTSGGG